jgi:hypothetical protein
MKPVNTRRFAGPAIILLAAAMATAPILLHGSYCGDDFEFHVVSWLDAQQGWLHGIPYPHWTASANYGAGEPRFMFYPPLTWMLGAAQGFVLPWQFVPIALVFLFLAGTGLAVRALALEALTDAPATLAGCAALFSDYALFTAYERTAFAELTGGFWIPLLLLFALRDRNSSASILRRTLDGSTLPLALIVAGAWLSNGPLGVMASYLLAAVALAASALARSWAHLLRATLAAALGMALAGLYLIPAAFEQRWADLRAAIVYPVFTIENNWLFDRPADPMLAPFWMVLFRASMLAVIMIGVALLSLLVVFLRRKRADALLDRRWWIPLALIPAAVLFLQLPVSHPVWNLLPKLRFLQYPWRWVLVVEAPMGIFFAAAIWPSQSAKRRLRVGIALFCGLVFLSTTWFAAKHFLRVCKEGDAAAEIAAWYRNGRGVEGTDEYEALGSDHWQIATGLPDACFTSDSDTTLGVAGPGESIPAWRPNQGSCEATVTAQVREPEHMRLAMVAAHPGFLILRLMSYPAWRVTVNGQRLAPFDPSDLRDDGLIAVPVPRGPVELTVDWSSTPDVVAGRCVSALALLLLIVLGLLERRLSRSQIAAA